MGKSSRPLKHSVIQTKTADGLEYCAGRKGEEMVIMRGGQIQVIFWRQSQGISFFLCDMK